jgi:hypothetical protein
LSADRERQESQKVKWRILSRSRAKSSFATFDVEMKKHHAKIKRIHVVDFDGALEDAERQLKNVGLGLWMLLDNAREPTEEEVEEERNALESHLQRLRELRNRARTSPVLFENSSDVPSCLVPHSLVHPYPLDSRPRFSYVLFHDNLYEASGPYTEDEFCLLVLEEFDRERRVFEKLHSVHVMGMEAVGTARRERVPEKTRIFVWRRDGGKCARCGSRERLEYDHIVPVAKGGSNTPRNIELLCEQCNRSKSDRIQ